MKCQRGVGHARVSFQLILMAMVIAILVGTVSVVGVVSRWNSKKTTRSLLGQMLNTVSPLVDSMIQSHLENAAEESNLTLNMFRTGRVDPKDFHTLAQFWLDIMKAHTNLVSMSVGLEENGDMLCVTRLQGGSYAIRELLYNPATGNLGLRVYRAEEYPDKPYYVDLGHNVGDPRGRPWYLKAKRGPPQVWADAYVFPGFNGIPDVLGIPLATCIPDDEGNLLGVMSVDLDPRSLCKLLAVHLQDPSSEGQRQDPSSDGHSESQRSRLAFIIEVGEDGQRRMIAHPEPKELIHVVPGEIPRAELVQADSFDDDRVRKFDEQIPDSEFNRSAHVEPVEFEVWDTRYLGGYVPVREANSPQWLICLAVEDSEILGSIHRTNWVTLGIGLASLAVAVAFSVYLASRISAPLKHLTRQAEDIGHLRLEPDSDHHSSLLEIDRLLQSAEEMKAGLRSFQKYVPQELVRNIIASGEEAVLGGQRREMTVFFADVVGFTAMAERLEPEELVDVLSEYNEVLSHEIGACRGTLDKYMGDSIMAFWGAPEPDPEQAAGACVAALRCQEALAELRRRWRDTDKPAMECRIGISTGELVVGNLGSQSRIHYTVIGDPVNLAKRLESLNSYYGTRIMVSESTWNLAGDGFVGRPIDRVRVKGKMESILVYELLARREDADEGLLDFAAVYRIGLEAYFDRRWEEASASFDAVLRDRPDDRPASRLSERCRSYQENPPAPDWNGAKILDTK